MHCSLVPGLGTLLDFQSVEVTKQDQKSLEKVVALEIRLYWKFLAVEAMGLAAEAEVAEMCYLDELGPVPLELW